jgi:putative MATE family efflux protein
MKSKSKELYIVKKSSEKLNELETGAISKLIWRFLLPAISMMMINSIYVIVDRIFVGQGVGAQGLAAMGAFHPINFVLVGFTALLGIGGGVNISIKLGQKKFDQAEKVLGNSLMLMMLFALIISIVGLTLSEVFLANLDFEPATLQLSKEYLTIILAGTLFNFVAFSLNTMILSEGNPRIAMLLMLVCVGLNILLDYIFIIHLNAGLKGAAFATVISQFVFAILGIIHFRSKRSVVKLKLKGLRPNWPVIRSILFIGFVPFTMHAASSVGAGIMNYQLIKYGGDLTVGAFGVIAGVVMLSLTSLVAVSNACQPILSYNHGAGNHFRVKQTLRYAIGIASALAIVCFALIELFPKQIISLFHSENTDFLNIGIRALKIYLISLPLLGLNTIVENYFLAIDKAGTAILLTLARHIILLIPILLILPDYFELDGVWMSSPLADFLYAIIILCILIIEFKKINRQCTAVIPELR